MNIDFENIVNARDLGGLNATGGRQVRYGCLMRTAHLHDASDDDVQRLCNEYHIRRIFDFRSLDEAKYMPDRDIPGSVHHLLPTIDMSEEKRTGKAIPEEAFLDLESHIVNYSFYPEVQQMAADMYPSLIRSEYSQLQYATFMRLIIETPDGGVLWHCFQGKDRTGWGAAFLLSALGVSRDDIIRDFDLSNAAYTGLVARLCKDVEERGGGDREKEVIRAFMGVSTNNFKRTLNLIDQEYGSMNEYLRNQLMITQKDIRTLRKRYLH
ncbi:tyrosine-protein phosphatase [Pseudoprevotella muciniphila]|uniref:Tyrosine-protein phosphatase n=1 Tax=Pseudoprevotella muciniphila TaxID=2133944 RepID=A0A5P8E8W0_9BACT|nr:tyrosine-protein phosphatase [Pseudoprevotella muciniphila]QFQ13372.1 tyrosine-protein phosphatase [Pseudoprevotella muciniphila]